VWRELQASGQLLFLRRCGHAACRECGDACSTVLALTCAGEDSAAPLSTPEIVRRVAQQLRHNAAEHRKSYIHPAVLAWCGEGAHVPDVKKKPRNVRGLNETAQQLLQLLARQPHPKRAARRQAATSAP